MLVVKINTAEADLSLKRLSARLENRRDFFQWWAEDVRDSAREKAGGYGGQEFWGQVADRIRISGVDNNGATVVSEHVASAQKQYGGPIRVKNKEWLTIPIHELSKRKTATMMRDMGYRLFRPGRSKRNPDGKKVLACWDGSNLVSLFALTKQTRSQRAYPFMPEEQEVLRMGIEAANEMIFSD